MILIRTSCNSNNRASRILIPMWRTKSCKSRHHITTVRVFHLGCHIFRVRCRINQPKFIAKPLDRCSRNKNGSFQRIIYLTVQSPRNRSNQTVFREYRLVSGVHKQEAAGTIGILCLSFMKACLSKKCRLLVARRSADWNLSAKKRCIRVSIYTA